jgi:hypothetical protein
MLRVRIGLVAVSKKAGNVRPAKIGSDRIAGEDAMIARWTIVGFVLWLIVTMAFRLAGHEVFKPGAGVQWLFLTLPPAIFALTYLVLKVLRVDPSDRSEAASIFAVPGLLLGIYQINSFRFVFPNLDQSMGAEFAALMFACYAAMIVCGIVSSRLQQFEKRA